MRNISHGRGLIEVASIFLSFLLSPDFFGLGRLLCLHKVGNFRRCLTPKLLLIGERFLTRLPSHANRFCFTQPVKIWKH